MPELPEVETVVRNLRVPLIGRTVQSMSYDWPRTIHSPSPDAFAERIVGQTFRAIERRAKYIVAALDHDFLMVHLKMTGRLYVTDTNEVHDADKWVHFRLGLDEGKELRFSDARKFGKVYLTADPEIITGTLGPEPLTDDFTEVIFRERLQHRSKNIKALLLDQTFIAGVGNIYADESLFRAGIHPLRRSDSLTDDEIIRLYGTVRDALNAGIDYEGASISWYRKPDGTKGSSQEHFLVYDQEGKPCQNCGTMIEKIRVAQRGTHYCPACQRLAEGSSNGDKL
ncbi:MAG: DNA-formamidopyrimidine glycosylase [bacterium]|nr:DNA-formamidopyrimidine glycosylase [bacterium]